MLSSSGRRRALLWTLLALALSGCTTTASSVPLEPLTVATRRPQAAAPLPAPARSAGDTVHEPSAGLPELTNKPEPVVETFEGCPITGDGGDPELNRLKNRVDSAPWYPVPVATILGLEWPQSIGGHPRRTWSTADQVAIGRYEGIPVQVEGYLAGAKQQGPESCNCHAADEVDNHLWVVDTPDKDRTQAVVAEVTPRMRARHPGWAFNRISPLVDHRTRVRISGWLMLDQEHPDQIGKTRGTIWEIHPIAAFDVQQGGTWVSLDTGQAVAAPPLAPNAVPTRDTLPPPEVEPTDAAHPATPLPPRRAGTAQGSSNHSGAVAIVDLHYRGSIKPSEPDEFVEIANEGDTPVDMSGWTLHDTYGDQRFRWNAFTLLPNRRIRIYTGEQHPESGGFSFGSSNAIWNNQGDAAELVDARGTVVATYAYGNRR